MKRILVYFLAFCVCGFSTWFATSYILGGQAQQWFENEETQIEQEQPEEMPGDNTETPGDNNGNVEEPGEETPVEVAGVALNADIFDGCYEDIYYSKKTSLELTLNTVDSENNVIGVYDGEISVRIAGAGGGFYAKDLSFEDSTAEWQDMRDYLGASDDGFSNYSIINFNEIRGVNVNVARPIINGWVLNYGFDSFDMDNLPYLIIEVTTEFGTFEFNYLCCYGFGEV